jgi:rubredoxin-NAD+ reductase
MTQKPMVVIGTGLAGYMFAKEWRKLNNEQPLILISRDDGHFYSKPLLSNALAKGKNPSELVTTPVETMREQLQATIHTHTVVTAIGADTQTITTEQETIAYDTLVLATGAKPITPPLAGDSDALWQVNHLSDYTPFHQAIHDSDSMVILGSGLIGCEFANDLLTHGHQVKVVSLDKSPLARLLPTEISQALQEKFAAAGVEWHFNETVESVSKTDSGVALNTASGKAISGDCALSAIGIVPDLSLAKSANLKTNRGILVDGFMQSSNPQIYAIGDCVELDERVEPYIAPLLLCARTLAKNLARPNDATTVDYPVMPVTIKTPLYPVICASPAPGIDGQWQCETDGDSIIARFVGDDGKLHGFTLGNAPGKLRMQLMKEVSNNG